MARKGLKRWGSTWVTADQLATLVKYQQDLQDRMTQMDSQYRSSQQTLAGMDAQIKQAQSDSDSAIAAVDYYNNQIMLLQQRAIDSTFVTAQRDQAQAGVQRAQQRIDALRAQKAQLAADLDQAQEDAGKLKQVVGSGTVAQYTGNQRIMDLGDADNPPPPTPVAVPAQLPARPGAPTPPKPADAPVIGVPMQGQPGPPVIAVPAR
jgi:hypothetical protein